MAAQINPNLPAFSVLTNKNPKTSESSSKIKSQNQNSPQNSQNLLESQILQQNPQEYFQKSYKSEELESSFESKNNSHLKLALANFEATMFFFFTHRSEEFKQFFEYFDGNLEVLGTDFEIFGEHNGSHIFEIWSDLLRTLEPNWNFATVSDLATFENMELEKEAELEKAKQTNLESLENEAKITKNLSNFSQKTSNLAPGSVSKSFSSPFSDLISDSNLPIYQDIFENKTTSWTNSEQSLISWLGNNNQDKSFEKLGQAYIKLQKLSQKVENSEKETTSKEKLQNEEKVENYQDNLANNPANSTDIFSLNSKNQKDVSKKFENSSQNRVEKTKNYSQDLEKVDLSDLVTGNIINLETKTHTFLETYKSLENSSNQNQPQNLEKTNSIKPNQNNQNSTKINLDKVWDFFGKLSTSDNFYYMSDLAEPDGLLHAMFNAYPSPQIAFETYWQILEIFENFLDNLGFYADLE